MARIDVLHHALNVGVVDADKLHRVDVERMRLAAEFQTNMMADTVGKGFMRAGTEYLATLPDDFRPIEFIAGNDQAALLCLYDEEMRVLDGQTDEIVTRVAVSTSVVDGDFSGSTGWTLASTAGQTTAISGGKLNLTARAHGGKAKATKTTSIAGGDVGVEHGLRIVVDRGPVQFRLGSASGLDDLIKATDLRSGEHSLAFTPTGSNIYIEISSEAQVLRIVDSIQIEAAGVISLPTPWPTAVLDYIRTAQSLDVMFCACEGYKEQRIERRGDRSWSVVDYDREDGPFQVGRTAEVTLTPSVLEGNGTLTASAAFFKPEHVGALFGLFHEGQAIDTYVAGPNQFTPAFLVSGITESNFEERKFSVTISGTWSGTLRHRRSYNGEDGAYHDFRREQASATIDITSNATYANDDNDDNYDIWVKMGFPAGLYTSGEARIQFSYPNGGGYGIARVVGYTSPTVVDIEVLTPFKGTGAVTNWRQTRYDGVMGYPAAVGFVDGRLSWAGNDLFDASISDAFDSYDETFEGDAGPISRSIALGGRNDARWMLPLASLMIGCDSRIANARASALEEVVTPDNFGMKSSGKVGAAPVSPAELADDRAVFVEQAGNSLYEITWSAEKGRYVVAPFSKLTSKLFELGITSINVQVRPDQRMWVGAVNADAACIIFEPSQQVLAAHIPISTSRDDHFFRRFAVLPGLKQDRVYAAVQRVIGGSTVYMLEKFARDDEAAVDTVCKVMDSHVTGTGAHATTIGGLDHLEGEGVVAWVDGAPVLDPSITTPGEDDSMVFTVTGGEIELPEAVTGGYCVGLAYDVKYKSARLAYGVEGYTPMLKNKALARLGLMLGDYVRSGVKYGTVRGGKGRFDAPWNLPDLSPATGDVAEEIVAGPGDDEWPVSPGSEIDLDIRVCVAGRSPKPFSILSLVLAIETYR